MNKFNSTVGFIRRLAAKGIDLKVKCEFEYCIYNRHFECIVDEPEINSVGMCDACIIISLDKEFLEKEKESHLLELESRWSKSAHGNENYNGSSKTMITSFNNVQPKSN